MGGISIVGGVGGNALAQAKAQALSNQDVEAIVSALGGSGGASADDLITGEAGDASAVAREVGNLGSVRAFASANPGPRILTGDLPRADDGNGRASATAIGRAATEARAEIRESNRYRRIEARTGIPLRTKHSEAFVAIDAPAPTALELFGVTEYAVGLGAPQENGLLDIVFTLSLSTREIGDVFQLEIVFGNSTPRSRAPIPEPTTVVMLGIGLAILGGRGRRRESLWTAIRARDARQ